MIKYLYPAARQCKNNANIFRSAVYPWESAVRPRREEHLVTFRHNGTQPPAVCSCYDRGWKNDGRCRRGGEARRNETWRRRRWMWKESRGWKRSRLTGKREKERERQHAKGIHERDSEGKMRSDDVGIDSVTDPRVYTHTRHANALLLFLARPTCVARRRRPRVTRASLWCFYI